MSTLVMAACWPLALPPAQKAVLISLADQANDQGVCWPSVSTIGVRTCLSDRTVQRALRDLHHERLLRVETGAMKANRYTLELEIIRARNVAPPPHPPPSPCHPRHGGGGVTMSPRGDTMTPQGCHHDTLTVIEPNTLSPLPPPGGVGLEEKKSAVAAQQELDAVPVKADKPTQGQTLRQFLAECQTMGVQAIPPDDPVYGYALSIGLPDAMLELQWFVFKRQRLTTGKRQRNWRQTFRNSVEGNWYRLWLLQPDGAYALSTQGHQAQRLRDAEASDEPR